MASNAQGPSGVVVMTQVYSPPENGNFQQNPAICTSRLCRLSAPVKEFVKGEPKALGATQIMIGVINILFGIALAFTGLSATVIAGIPFWGGLVFIITGSLTVSVDKHNNICLVKGSLGMNIVSSLTASSVAILYCIDAVISYSEYYSCDNYSSPENDYCMQLQIATDLTVKCIKGILVFFAVLELCIAISLAAFGCKATCCTYSSPSQPIILMQNPQVLQTSEGFPPQPPHVAHVLQPQQTPHLPTWNMDTQPDPPAYHDPAFFKKYGVVKTSF
ncbi:membrane-spanning 4-domains subfamily A member 4D-like isoform X1 [Protopterus annectens]|uniref:membrane-spanning 4-domains subfamily A member 4D-like isoform X1 n=1 Tax=Protopterus annectens TaxID=7888 RepID=UPI001CFA04B3|nr:membrane-spanning 4-domains subfamily A member 4D-like isoform X1 [Protopterus annectens]